MNDRKLELAGRLAAQPRVDSIRCSTEAGSAQIEMASGGAVRLDREVGGGAALVLRRRRRGG